MKERNGGKWRGLLGTALVLGVMGCGTILYPERKGHKGGGQLDVAVVALDAVGLLFFIIPGVIAFAVDFNNGSIYLPKGKKGLLNYNDVERLRFSPGPGAKSRVEELIGERTGLSIRLDQSGVKIARLESAAEIPSRLAAAPR